MYLTFDKEKTCRYLVTVTIKTDFDLCKKENMSKLLSRLGPINDTVDRISNTRKEVLFRSEQRDVIGFVIVSNLTAKAIADTFFGNTKLTQTACLFDDDTVFVSEIGGDNTWYPIGASRAWTFLQRHKS